jgi:hypothetical protein
MTTNPRLSLRLLGAIVLLVAVLVAAFALSPWPGALLIRTLFDHGAAQVSARLQPHVPDGVLEHLGEVYDASRPNGLFDLFLPPLPHEYPFDLDRPEGRRALSEAVAFVQTHAR